jgi:GDPmannose 4,6-dehydratase
VCNGILFNHESYLRSDNFLIKKVIKSALLIKNKKLDKLVVGNLNLKRDFGYAPEYVLAMWKILQLDTADDFIISSGISIKLRDIVEYVFQKLDIDKRLIIEDRKLFRPNEIVEIYGDNSKAKKILDWNYNFSFFDVLDELINEEINNS